MYDMFVFRLVLRVKGLSLGRIQARSTGKSKSSAAMIASTIFSCSYFDGVTVMGASVAMCMRNHTTGRLIFPRCSAARRCSSWFANWISSLSASYSAQTVVAVIWFVAIGCCFFLMVMGTLVHPDSVVVMVLLVLLSQLIFALFAIEA